VIKLHHLYCPNIPLYETCDFSGDVESSCGLPGRDTVWQNSSIFRQHGSPKRWFHTTLLYGVYPDNRDFNTSVHLETFL